MNRPSFYWWDDAVDVARTIAAQTGIRQRVYRTAGLNPWRVRPAALRCVR